MNASQMSWHSPACRRQALLAVLFAYFKEESDRKSATVVLLQTPVWCE
jgi:hypothetical protein